jgi:hypothetical protein
MNLKNNPNHHLLPLEQPLDHTLVPPSATKVSCPFAPSVSTLSNLSVWSVFPLVATLLPLVATLLPLVAPLLPGIHVQLSFHEVWNLRSIAAS